MSVKALVVVAVLGVVAWPGAGRAEKVKTNQSTKLYSRAGEQAPVLLKVKSGQSMTVLVKDGRWIKVRVSGRTGWIPRSKVDLPEGDDEIARNTRRRPFVDGRGTRRGFGGENGPDDRVGADAVGEGQDDPPERDSKPARGKPEKVAREEKPEKPEKPAKGGKKPPAKGGDDDVVSVDDDDDTPEGGAPAVVEDGAGGDTGEEKPPARPMAHVAKATTIYDKPDKASGEAFTADPKVALFVGKTKGNWTRVSTDDGDAGYVLTSKLDIEDPGDTAGGPRKRLIDGRGRLGITLVKQSLSTPGGMGVVPDNYAASSSSLTIAIGGTVLYPYKTRYWVGGDLSYDFDKAIPGISYMSSTTGFTYHVLNLRAVGAYDLQKPNGMMVYARFGLHYDSFQVNDVINFMKNTAKLPNQIIAAPIFGAALGIPKLTPKLGLMVNLDFIPFLASVSQTKNLEDGTGPSAKAIYLGGRLTYRWKPKMDLQLTYDLGYTSISFAGMPPATSMRGHTGTGPSSGSDLNNALSGGISYAF